LAGQTLIVEAEPRDAIWSRRGAPNTIPPAEVGAHGPIAQGSIWIAGDTLLEMEQRAKILAALMNSRAMGAGNSSVTQEQQGQQYMHVHFHPGCLDGTPVIGKAARMFTRRIELQQEKSY
jgi:hypothetical protein